MLVGRVLVPAAHATPAQLQMELLLAMAMSHKPASPAASAIMATRSAGGSSADGGSATADGGTVSETAVTAMPALPRNAASAAAAAPGWVAATRLEEMAVTEAALAAATAKATVTPLALCRRWRPPAGLLNAAKLWTTTAEGTTAATAATTAAKEVC